MDENNRKNQKDSTEQIEKKLSEKNETKKSLKKTIILTIVASTVLSVTLGSVFGFLAGGIYEKQLREYLKEQGVSERQNKEAEEDALITTKKEDSLVISAVEDASPAVVSIIVTKDVPKLDNFFFDPFSNDPFFNPFGFRERPQQEEPETEKREIGGGTGFIVDSEGYIITNRHVVSDEEAEYTVMLNDGSEKEAKVLGRDSFLDVAILKIEGESLPKVDIGNSDNLKIGQTVIAIGNSLGEFRNTVSKGIVSGLKRNVKASSGMGQTELLDEVIQTDAAINPGNSGGPLLNINGEVIGVNVAMAQGAENIGFSIPVNQVKKIYESVKESGKISRPYLGVRYMVINEQMQEQNDLPFDYGALIVRGESRSDLAVIPGSPADKAGLTENDIILEIDGQRVTKENDLAKIIRNKEVGQEITIEYWDGEETQVVEAELGEAS